jgi:asparagine synthase (glutamine-hydrolysing)
MCRTAPIESSYPMIFAKQRPISGSSFALNPPDMCGITGIVSSAGRWIEPDRLAKMTAMVEHRGPDDCGMYVEPSAALGHARLSILDLAGGCQPMSNEAGTLWITFNGEIFNYIELRNELVRKGHRFRTRTDTEVILHLYEEEGAEAVWRLNGQWAFGIWDIRTRTLFLSRDRIGIRPLFYTTAGRQFLFASEIKALFAHPEVSREIDPRGLDNIFTFWTALEPRTAFQNIHSLPPGHSLTWCDGRVAITQHWQPSYAPAESWTDAQPHSVADSVETLRSLLEDATRLRLRSDVPVGAYLSGGLDSSLIVALMQRVGGGPMRTFSIAFDDAEFDESAHQRQVVRALKTDHVELRCSDADISRVFADVVWHAETPLVRTAPAPLLLLAAAAKSNGCKVVLTGEGADEMFGGYDIFKEAKIRRFWARRPSSARRASLVKRLYPYLRDLQRQPAAYLQAFFHVASEDLANPCFSHLPRWRLTSRLKVFFSDALRASLSDYDGYADVASRLPADHGRWDPFCQSQYLETAHLLPGYLLSSQGDRVAMAHGVEGRYPFLDPNVVEFAARLDPRLKMKALNEKYLLKQVARDLVPAQVWRRSKQPYRSPDGRAFFKGRMAAYVEDLLSQDQLRRDGIFNPETVSRLVQKFQHGKAIGVKDGMALVGVLSTQIIIDRFINNFGTVTHGSPYSGIAAIHRRELPLRRQI